MTWREALIARILLIVARMVADDPMVAQALANLQNHIQAGYKAAAHQMLEAGEAE